MRYVNGDIIKYDDMLFIIDYPLRDSKGRTNNIEFRVNIVESIDYENEKIVKGRCIHHFFMNKYCELVIRTRPELVDKNIKHNYKIGQLLEIKGYATKRYEITKIEDGIVYIQNYKGYATNLFDYTIGELLESKFKIIGMKPEPYVQSEKERQRIEYYLEKERQREEKESEERWKRRSSVGYYSPLIWGDLFDE